MAQASSGDPKFTKYPDKPRVGVFTKDYGKMSGAGKANWQTNPMKAARVAVAGWGKYISTIGTYHGHMPSIGLAMDIMRASGCEGPNLQEFWDMAFFFQKYHRQFGIDYMIFRDRIWNPGNGDPIGKFTRTDNYNNGDCTNHHADHIHISYHPGNAGNRSERPIPPHLLEKRKPKNISVNFVWDDQGEKSKTGYTSKERDLTKKKPKGWSNAKYIWAAMRNWGITEQAVAGIMGNLNQESGLDPGINEQGGGPGWGLAQWSFSRRPKLLNWLKKQNLPNDSLEGQVRFIWREMNEPSYKSLVPILKNSSTTVQEACVKFHNIYEGSNDNAAQMQERIDDAKKFYNQFKGSTFHLDTVAGGTEKAVEPPPDDFILSVLPAGIYTVTALAPTDLGAVAFLPPEPGEDDGGDDALTDLEAI